MKKIAPAQNKKKNKNLNNYALQHGVKQQKNHALNLRHL